MSKSTDSNIRAAGQFFITPRKSDDTTAAYMERPEHSMQKIENASSRKNNIQVD
ncbi:MAG: hypothetical protein ISR54_08585 [Chlorobium phaeobacteroides]|nr:hypothetical protein [Chlorobium phaeobacteroides]MBL6956852.1 hypothetical protein [Chlorobium phaeobacteroides]